MSSTSETSPWQQQGFTSPGLFTKSESPSSLIEQDIVGDPVYYLSDLCVYVNTVIQTLVRIV